MNPDNQLPQTPPTTPLPHDPLQTPVSQPIVASNVSQPRKSKLWFVMVAVIIPVVAIAAWVVIAKPFKPASQNTSYTSSGDSQLGELQAGAFNYISACQALTADDVETATGKASDREAITADFATKTYKSDDPQRTYQSTCTRYLRDAGALLGTSIRLSIDNYSYEPLQTKMRALSTPYPTDDAIQQQFGKYAQYSQEDRILVFEINNKRITISTGDDDYSRDAITKIGVAVAAKVRELSAQASKQLDYALQGAKVNTFTYQNACTLWTPDDYSTITGAKPDEAAIHTVYAETIQTNTKSKQGRVNSECTINAQPAKTQMDSGDVSEIATKKSLVKVATEQFEDTEYAKYIFNSPYGTDHTNVAGIGDEDAHLSTTDFGYLLQARKGNTVIKVNIASTSFSNDLNADESLALLKKVASAVIGHIQ